MSRGEEESMARVVVAVLSAAVLGAVLVGAFGSLMIAASVGILIVGIGLGAAALVVRVKHRASGGSDA